MIHKFDPKHMQKLDNSERRELLPPVETLQKLHLQSGQTFLDIGAGIGYFSFPALAIVGPNGNVIAADTSVEMIDELRRRTTESGAALTITRSEEYSIGLPDCSIDVALLAFVFHEIENSDLLLKEIWRLLKPNGTLAIIEWKKENTEKGPPLQSRISPEETIQKLKMNEMKIFEHGDLNDSNYYVIGQK
jgi:ubiquinone/menaquinone biosynthesis C-methylase UbiE